jgi:hypothetical protein
MEKMLRKSDPNPLQGVSLRALGGRMPSACGGSFLRATGADDRSAQLKEAKAFDFPCQTTSSICESQAALYGAALYGEICGFKCRLPWKESGFTSLDPRVDSPENKM